MADISSTLEQILAAVYGEEVRGAIHDALIAMNAQAEQAIHDSSDAKDSAKASAQAAKTAQDGAERARELADQMLQETVEAKQDAEAARDAAQRSQDAAQTALDDSLASALAAARDAQSAREGADTARSRAEAAETAAQSAKDDAESSQRAAETARDETEVIARNAQQYATKPPKPQNGTWWIWNAEMQEYADSGVSCELEGPRGVGVESFAQTGGDHSPGSTDIYTLTLTDGSSVSVPVYNGRNGEGSGDVRGCVFELTLPTSGWTEGTLTVEDERLLASAMYRYFISAGEACRDEFLRCAVRPDNITVSGRMAFTGRETPAADITVEVIRLELPGSSG